jgi:surface protein
MHFIFFGLILGCPLFVRGYSYENGIVKCPDESVGSEFNVTELNKTFKKVNRTMLIVYRDYNYFENLNTSCTTGVTDMNNMFWDKQTLNADISKWDTSSVTNMNGMFDGAWEFNSDLSNWDTSNVEDMSFMFYSASVFNSDISDWNTSNVKYMRGMFAGAFKFNSDISKWDTSSVKYMH